MMRKKDKKKENRKPREKNYANEYRIGLAKESRKLTSYGERRKDR